ncbi:transcriptional repressor general negative regulator of transcription subunit 4 [Scheffersomyces stipitis CBS 6054]|uniref:Transcriptional repressor general negative regulator of transcription subunit 4 n=1 Tax=Scheffersomyces stipitis (strain ATCC 58785 / CBS 6054 / NBRC 10063 / NRRL Y-11545) TaxID=322104 RepID=A3M0E9_PICST|nr:transcriptional repressor general negative regulator of transcription subunit 4 [Scheffersomyces stipitis CBS 6054]ABN68513.2 transcriptional repressor general negative regulator of transcription subunit 4 [Scheffersomyces stipitis CBS 6054]
MVPSDDSFISDNEEEYCPLCVEEMDISDKNFKPCPCGYQICQFCYNNIKQNPELNGRCPGCRRLYDDESVEYKTISAEEYRLQQLKKEKREREKKQREKEKKETEMANKKHLAGLRVVQKNLVYVTGLNPPCNPEDLHSVLRSDKYFGQYGKISKIVINTKTPTASGSHHHHQNPGLVVYVTFAKKEDALKCINELDGSLCDGRVLRAAHGTTKYCSSYLRGHPCPNPNCMFLHEPGEEADSYTRKDLSTQQGIKMSMMGLVSSSSNISNSGHFQAHSATNSQSNYSGDEDTSSGPILPASVQWAKAGSNSASNSPSVNNNTPLANSAAFPTLGEIFRDQKSQQKKDLKQKIKSKVSKDNVLLPDDIDIDDDSVLGFIDSTSECLRDLQQRKEKLNVHFSKLSNRTGSVLPLFAFNSTEGLSHDTRLEEETLLARQVIERFFLRPIKNYHLAYQNHPIAQQQTLQNQIQQQQQQQQQRQQPGFQAASLEQLQADQQRKLLEAQQVEGSAISQQQAQQQLLLLQLQQQQQQSQQANQINMLRATERGNTSTPPPPGLFAANSNAPVAAPAAGAQSSSSQLLTQLMSGKR